ncbi:hypothetical protein M407DRAFT_241038 [Tulasnella calospora MUT 4182]|uniref:Uncharacterized protein n=1 Tax=Tulasnella calospora MUT 4182 TaxID=1051891 RepID=A0A0C3LHI2_9AGAM|nr:hypothetical protein M407DRAFT_241038 [Tulasnella calospora MUT 4182]
MSSSGTISRNLSHSYCPVQKIPVQAPAAQNDSQEAGNILVVVGRSNNGAVARKHSPDTVSIIPSHRK